MKSPRQQLDSLLSESPTVARTREYSTFDEAIAGRNKAVIFGAGRLGRAIRRGLRSTHITPVAFADNNPHTWGTQVEGLPVLPPCAASEQYAKSAAFIVAIWHPSSSPLMSPLLEQLRNLNCTAVSFPVLFWRYSRTFLPYFFWESPSVLLQQAYDIAAAFDLLHEESSRRTFVAQLRLRLHADFDCLGMPCPGEQYFPGLFFLNAEECFVDCGAYTGDTIESFARQAVDGFRKVIAFEADPAVLSGLRSFMQALGSRALLHESAVAARTGVVHFSGDGIGGGRVTVNSSAEVPCVSLDDALVHEPVTMIKMDIEGSELKALEGAHRVIWRDRPVLAICGYHRPDHLWRVLASLKTLAPDWALFLRSHCADGLDTVCYAVPPERQISAATDTRHRSPIHRRVLARSSAS